MPSKKSKCQCPKNLKGGPEDCTPEQTRKCHGTKKSHPCLKQAVHK